MEIHMQPKTRAALLAYGMDVDATLLRYGGNTSLLCRHLNRFPHEGSFALLEAAMQAGRVEEAKAACHALKGVSGNLGLTPLYTATGSMMASLRAGCQEDAGTAWQAVSAAYREAVAVLESLPLAEPSAVSG